MGKVNPDRVYDGKTIRQWAVETGFTMKTVQSRIQRGLPLEGVRCSTRAAHARHAKQFSKWNDPTYFRIYGSKFTSKRQGKTGKE